MNHKLPLSSFQVPAREKLPIRMVRSIQLRAPEEDSPFQRVASREHLGSARQLILTRTFARSVTLVGTLTTIGLFLLVLGWGELAQGAPVRRADWAEGVVVSADVSHHSFVLAQRGRNLLVVWNGQTHQWDRTTLTKRGKAVDPAALASGRVARVLIQRQGNSLLARRIIFLSGQTGLTPAGSAPPAS